MEGPVPREKESSMRTRSNVSIVLVITIALTISALGCASSEVGKPIAANDVASLAGNWTGTLTLPSGRPVEGTMQISPNGDYLTQAEAFVARGKVEVKDGSFVFIPSSTSGGLGLVTGPRTSVAGLSQRADGTLMLTGNGHSDTGPFSFEVTRHQ